MNRFTLIQLFKLPELPRRDILLQLPPEQLETIYELDDKFKKLCQEDYALWIQRIKEECPEYEVTDIEITKDNAYYKWLQSQSELKYLKHKFINFNESDIWDEIVTILYNILNNDNDTIINIIYIIRLITVQQEKIARLSLECILITIAEEFINKNEKEILSLIKWLVNYFNISINESSTAFYQSCARDTLPICKWLHNHFNYTTLHNNLIKDSFTIACEHGCSSIIEWMEFKFKQY